MERHAAPQGWGSSSLFDRFRDEERRFRSWQAGQAAVKEATALEQEEGVVVNIDVPEPHPVHNSVASQIAKQNNVVRKRVRDEAAERPFTTDIRTAWLSAHSIDARFQPRDTAAIELATARRALAGRRDEAALRAGQHQVQSVSIARTMADAVVTPVVEDAPVPSQHQLRTAAAAQGARATSMAEMDRVGGADTVAAEAADPRGPRRPLLLEVPWFDCAATVSHIARDSGALPPPPPPPAAAAADGASPDEGSQREEQRAAAVEKLRGLRRAVAGTDVFPSTLTHDGTAGAGLFEEVLALFSQVRGPAAERERLRRAARGLDAEPRAAAGLAGSVPIVMDGGVAGEEDAERLRLARRDLAGDPFGLRPLRRAAVLRVRREFESTVAEAPREPEDGSPVASMRLRTTAIAVSALVEGVDRVVRTSIPLEAFFGLMRAEGQRMQRAAESGVEEARAEHIEALEAARKGREHRVMHPPTDEERTVEVAVQVDVQDARGRRRDAAGGHSGEAPLPPGLTTQLGPGSSTAGSSGVARHGGGSDAPSSAVGEAAVAAGGGARDFSAPASLGTERITPVEDAERRRIADAEAARKYAERRRRAVSGILPWVAEVEAVCDRGDGHEPALGVAEASPAGVDPADEGPGGPKTRLKAGTDEVVFGLAPVSEARAEDKRLRRSHLMRPDPLVVQAATATELPQPPPAVLEAFVALIQLAVAHEPGPNPARGSRLEGWDEARSEPDAAGRDVPTTGGGIGGIRCIGRFDPAGRHYGQPTETLAVGGRAWELQDVQGARLLGRSANLIPPSLTTPAASDVMRLRHQLWRQAMRGGEFVMSSGGEYAPAPLIADAQRPSRAPAGPAASSQADEHAAAEREAVEAQAEEALRADASQRAARAARVAAEALVEAGSLISFRSLMGDTELLGAGPVDTSVPLAQLLREKADTYVPPHLDDEEPVVPLSINLPRLRHLVGRVPGAAMVGRLDPTVLIVRDVSEVRRAKQARLRASRRASRTPAPPEGATALDQRPAGVTGTVPPPRHGLSETPFTVLSTSDAPQRSAGVRGGGADGGDTTSAAVEWGGETHFTGGATPGTPGQKEEEHEEGVAHAADGESEEEEEVEEADPILVAMVVRALDAPRTMRADVAEEFEGGEEEVQRVGEGHNPRRGLAGRVVVPDPAAGTVPAASTVASVSASLLPAPRTASDFSTAPTVVGVSSQAVPAVDGVPEQPGHRRVLDGEHQPFGERNAERLAEALQGGGPAAAEAVRRGLLDKISSERNPAMGWRLLDLMPSIRSTTNHTAASYGITQRAARPSEPRLWTQRYTWHSDDAMKAAGPASALDYLYMVSNTAITGGPNRPNVYTVRLEGERAVRVDSTSLTLWAQEEKRRERHRQELLARAREARHARAVAAADRERSELRARLAAQWREKRVRSLARAGGVAPSMMLDGVEWQARRAHARARVTGRHGGWERWVVLAEGSADLDAPDLVAALAGAGAGGPPREDYDAVFYHHPESGESSWDPPAGWPVADRLEDAGSGDEDGHEAGPPGGAPSLELALRHAGVDPLGLAGEQRDTMRLLEDASGPNEAAAAGAAAAAAMPSAGHTPLVTASSLLAGLSDAEVISVTPATMSPLEVAAAVEECVARAFARALRRWFAECAARAAIDPAESDDGRGQVIAAGEAIGGDGLAAGARSEGSGMPAAAFRAIEVSTFKALGDERQIDPARRLTYRRHLRGMLGGEAPGRALSARLEDAGLNAGAPGQAAPDEEDDVLSVYADDDIPALHPGFKEGSGGVSAPGQPWAPGPTDTFDLGLVFRWLDRDGDGVVSLRDWGLVTGAGLTEEDLEAAGAALAAAATPARAVDGSVDVRPGDLAACKLLLAGVWPYFRTSLCRILPVPLRPLLQRLVPGIVNEDVSEALGLLGGYDGDDDEGSLDGEGGGNMDDSGFLDAPDAVRAMSALITPSVRLRTFQTLKRQVAFPTKPDKKPNHVSYGEFVRWELGLSGGMSWFGVHSELGACSPVRTWQEEALRRRVCEAAAEWQSAVDPSSSLRYYVSAVSGASVWEKGIPQLAAEAAARRVAHRVLSEELRGEEALCRDLLRRARRALRRHRHMMTAARMDQAAAATMGAGGGGGGGGPPSEFEGLDGDESQLDGGGGAGGGEFGLEGLVHALGSDHRLLCMLAEKLGLPRPPTPPPQDERARALAGTAMMELEASGRDVEDEGPDLPPGMAVRPLSPVSARDDDNDPAGEEGGVVRFDEGGPPLQPPPGPPPAHMAHRHHRHRAGADGGGGYGPGPDGGGELAVDFPRAGGEAAEEEEEIPAYLQPSATRPGAQWKKLQLPSGARVHKLRDKAKKPHVLTSKSSDGLNETNRPMPVGMVVPSEVTDTRPRESMPLPSGLVITDIVGDAARLSAANRPAGLPSADASLVEHEAAKAEFERSIQNGGGSGGGGAAAGGGGGAAADGGGPDALAAATGSKPDANKVRVWEEKCFTLIRGGKLTGLRDILVESNGAVDVNKVRDPAGNTMLIVAAQNNQRRICKELLRRGANMDLQNNRGNTALHYAFAYNYSELAEYMVTKGADETVTNAEGLAPREGLERAAVDDL